MNFQIPHLDIVQITKSEFFAQLTVISSVNHQRSLRCKASCGFIRLSMQFHILWIHLVSIFNSSVDGLLLLLRQTLDGQSAQRTGVACRGI